jgi:hypothetical protein
MSAIDQVKAHFSRLSVRAIEVPEWGEDGKPLVMYVKPTTLAEKATLYQIGEDHGMAQKNAHNIVMKALNAQGEKLFSIEDKHALMHEADAGVVLRVVLEINAAPTPEQIEKK